MRTTEANYRYVALASEILATNSARVTVHVRPADRPDETLNFFPVSGIRDRVFEAFSEIGAPTERKNATTVGTSLIVIPPDAPAGHEVMVIEFTCRLPATADQSAVLNFAVEMVRASQLGCDECGCHVAYSGPKEVGPDATCEGCGHKLKDVHWIYAGEDGYVRTRPVGSDFV